MLLNLPQYLHSRASTLHTSTTLKCQIYIRHTLLHRLKRLLTIRIRTKRKRLVGQLSLVMLALRRTIPSQQAVTSIHLLPRGRVLTDNVAIGPAQPLHLYRPTALQKLLTILLCTFAQRQPTFITLPLRQPARRIILQPLPTMPRILPPFRLILRIRLSNQSLLTFTIT